MRRIYHRTINLPDVYQILPLIKIIFLVIFRMFANNQISFLRNKPALTLLYHVSTSTANTKKISKSEILRFDLLGCISHLTSKCRLLPLRMASLLFKGLVRIYFLQVEYTKLDLETFEKKLLFKKPQTRRLKKPRITFKSVEMNLRSFENDFDRAFTDESQIVFADEFFSVKGAVLPRFECKGDSSIGFPVMRDLECSGSDLSIQDMMKDYFLFVVDAQFNIFVFDLASIVRNGAVHPDGEHLTRFYPKFLEGISPTTVHGSKALHSAIEGSIGVHKDHTDQKMNNKRFKTQLNTLKNSDLFSNVVKYRNSDQKTPINNLKSGNVSSNVTNPTDSSPITLLRPLLNGDAPLDSTTPRNYSPRILKTLHRALESGDMSLDSTTPRISNPMILKTLLRALGGGDLSPHRISSNKTTGYVLNEEGPTPCIKFLGGFDGPSSGETKSQESVRINEYFILHKETPIESSFKLKITKLNYFLKLVELKSEESAAGILTTYNEHMNPMILLKRSKSWDPFPSMSKSSLDEGFIGSKDLFLEFLRTHMVETAHLPEIIARFRQFMVENVLTQTEIPPATLRNSLSADSGLHSVTDHFFENELPCVSDRDRLESSMTHLITKDLKTRKKIDRRILLNPTDHVSGLKDADLQNSVEFTVMSSTHTSFNLVTLAERYLLEKSSNIRILDLCKQIIGNVLESMTERFEMSFNQRTAENSGGLTSLSSVNGLKSATNKPYGCLHLTNMNTPEIKREAVKTKLECSEGIRKRSLSFLRSPISSSSRRPSDLFDTHNKIEHHIEAQDVKWGHCGLLSESNRVGIPMKCTTFNPLRGVPGQSAKPNEFEHHNSRSIPCDFEEAPNRVGIPMKCTTFNPLRGVPGQSTKPNEFEHQIGANKDILEPMNHIEAKRGCLSVFKLPAPYSLKESKKRKLSAIVITSQAKKNLELGSYAHCVKYIRNFAKIMQQIPFESIQSTYFTQQGIFSLINGLFECFDLCTKDSDIHSYALEMRIATICMFNLFISLPFEALQTRLFDRLRFHFIKYIRNRDIIMADNISFNDILKSAEQYQLSVDKGPIKYIKPNIKQLVLRELAILHSFIIKNIYRTNDRLFYEENVSACKNFHQEFLYYNFSQISTIISSTILEFQIDSVELQEFSTYTLPGSHPGIEPLKNLLNLHKILIHSRKNIPNVSFSNLLGILKPVSRAHVKNETKNSLSKNHILNEIFKILRKSSKTANKTLITNIESRNRQPTISGNISIDFENCADRKASESDFILEKGMSFNSQVSGMNRLRRAGAFIYLLEQLSSYGLRAFQEEPYGCIEIK